MQGVCTGDIVVSQFDPVPNRFFFFFVFGIQFKDLYAIIMCDAKRRDGSTVMVTVEPRRER